MALRVEGSAPTKKGGDWPPRSPVSCQRLPVWCVVRRVLVALAAAGALMFMHQAVGERGTQHERTDGVAVVDVVAVSGPIPGLTIVLVPVPARGNPIVWMRGMQCRRMTRTVIVGDDSVAVRGACRRGGSRQQRDKCGKNEVFVHTVTPGCRCYSCDTACLRLNHA